MLRYKWAGLVVVLLALCVSTTSQELESSPLEPLEPVESLEPVEPLAPQEIPVETGPFEHVAFRPIDEARRDKDFTEFRVHLVAAVETKDLHFLVSHLAEDVKTGGGQVEGIAAFRQMWRLDSNPDASPIWGELKGILKFGGTFQRDVFTAPYVATRFPSQFDPYRYGVITGANVNVREGPGSTARRVSKVTYTVVRIIRDLKDKRFEEYIGGESHPWQKIGLPSGEIAYVYGKYLRTALDYRASFKPSGSKWKMIALVSGE